jgi:hypothetical protein
MQSSLNIFSVGVPTPGQAFASPSSSEKSKFQLVTAASAPAKGTRRQASRTTNKPRKSKETIYDENIGFFSAGPQFETPKTTGLQPELQPVTPESPLHHKTKQ